MKIEKNKYLFSKEELDEIKNTISSEGNQPIFIVDEVEFIIEHSYLIVIKDNSEDPDGNKVDTTFLRYQDKEVGSNFSRIIGDINKNYVYKLCELFKELIKSVLGITNYNNLSLKREVVELENLKNHIEQYCRRGVVLSNGDENYTVFTKIDTSTIDESIKILTNNIKV